MPDAGTTAAQVGSFAAQTALLAAYQARLRKALLIVRTKKDSLGSELGLNSIGLQTNSDVAALRSLVKSKGGGGGIMGRLKNAGKSLASAAGVSTEAIAAAKNEAMLKAELMAKNFVSMEVQYNPATLRMTAIGGGEYQTYSGPGDRGISQMTNYKKSTTTYLNVTLIFEDIEDADAFGSADAALNLGNLVSNVKSTITNWAKGGYTVRPQVEALISLLTYKRTRQVIFYWTDIFFHGEVTSVDANYTMFNKKGHPIKAEVTLNITQSDSADAFASDNDYWDAAFDNAFT